MNKLSWLLIAFCLAGVALGADKNAWKSRTIYQLLTDRYWRSNGDTSSYCDLGKYCGGDFDGITQQLQYIKDLGFDAIWISPVVDNIEGGYHGYWFRNFERINDHFGGEAALKRMVDAAHAMDIWVMVDVVANHVGPVGHDYSSIYPFNQEYHYHPDCDIKDWNNQWQVEMCRLCGLPDLDQANPFVRGYLKDWIRTHVQKFNFDGIRIDTVPEVEKNFWSEYTQSAGVFSIGEIFNGNDGYIGQYQNHMDSALNYGMHYTIRDVFARGQSMKQIPDRWAANYRSYKDVDVLGLFVDNHDNARFLNSQGDWRLFKSALLFSLTGRGIPIFYYGSEQGFNGGGDPQNREPLWKAMNRNHEIFKFVQAANKARRIQGAATAPFAEKWVDDNLYVFTRGRFFVALTNRVNGSFSADVPNTGFNDGQNLCNIFNSGDCTTIRNGKLSFTLNNGEAKIYIPRESSYFQSSKVAAYDHLKLSQV